MQTVFSQMSDGRYRFMMQAWRPAMPLIIAAHSAHVAIVLLTELFAPVPLATALVATIVFAGISAAYSKLLNEHVSNEAISSLQWLIMAALACLGIWAGGGLVASTIGSASTFYCHAAVPWRIEIALFGSFAAGYLGTVAAIRERAWLVYPLTMVAFLWIAPFYGFFSAPVFLGLSLNVECPDRSLATAVLAALGMVVGDRIGAVFARHLSEAAGNRE